MIYILRIRKNFKMIEKVALLNIKKLNKYQFLVCLDFLEFF